MTKVNPANKAVEEAEEEQEEDELSGEEKINQMLEKYKEIKEQTDTRISVDEAVEYLPDYAFIENGKLFIRGNETSRRDERQSLTAARKAILKAKANQPDKSPSDLSNELEWSESYINLTLRDWPFLLEDPRLFEAFVLDGRQSKNSWMVETEDGNEFHVPSRQLGEKMVKKKWANDNLEATLVSPDGEEFTLKDIVGVYVPGEAKKEGGSIEERKSPSHIAALQEDLEEAAEEAIERMEKPDDSDDSEDQSGESEDSDVVEASAHLTSSGDTEAESSGVQVNMSVSQFSKVLNGLYRDKNGDVAEALLRDVIENE